MELETEKKVSRSEFNVGTANEAGLCLKKIN